MDIILSFVILLGIGHKNFAIEIADAEWSITCRKVGVDEAIGINLMKTLVEGVDLARMKICRIQEIVTVGDAEGCALVDGAVNTAVRAIIHSDDGVGLIQRRVPARNGAVFTHKDENRGRGSSILCDLEERGAVKHDSGRIATIPVPRGGTFLQFGVSAPTTRVEIAPYEIYNREITVTGSMAVLHSFQRAVELFAAGFVDWRRIITTQRPLEDYPDALAAFGRGEGIKTQVLPDPRT